MKQASNQQNANFLSRRTTLQLLGGATLAGGMLGSGQIALAETPKRGGTLRVGLGQGATTDSLDPVTYNKVADYVMGCTICNTLVQIDPQGVPQPELAESWESSDGAKRWVFKLRSGVTFHNGKPLTGADVVYSIKRHQGENSKSSVKRLLDGVTGVSANGNEITLLHATGDADMAEIMGQFALLIVPEGHDDWSNLIGTGGYMLESFEPGVRMRATRNPNYWRSDAAWVDAVEFTVILDNTARTVALSTNAVDYIDKVDNKIAKRLAKNPNVAINESKGGRVIHFAMDVTADPYSSNDVREAMKYAINRQQIVDTALSGYGIVGNDHPVPPTNPYFNTELPQRAYDPDKAKFHLKKAGLNSAAVTLSTSDTVFGGAVDAAVIYQSNAAEAGIDIEVSRETADGYWSDIWMKKPFYTSTWVMRPTPGLMLSTAWSCNASWPETKWCNETFDSILAASKTETDPAKKKAMMWDLQELAHSDGGAIIFAFPSNLDAHSVKVNGAVPHAAAPFNGGRIAEQVWLS